MNLIPRNCLAFGVTHDSTPSQSILMKLLLSFFFKSSMEWRQEFYTSCFHQFYLSTNKLGVFYLVSLRSFGPHCFRRTSFSSLRRLRTKKMFFFGGKTKNLLMPRASGVHLASVQNICGLYRDHAWFRDEVELTVTRPAVDLWRDKSLMNSFRFMAFWTRL